MEIEVARTRARDALRSLEAHRDRINRLNVYPVPDGDTGTNMALTVRAIVDALDASEATDGEAIAHEIARAALMGARGNSGVILSQIVRGLAEALGTRDDVDAALLARAFRAASDAAYGAIEPPVEGTMLTVIREMAEEAERPDVATLAKEDLLLRVVARGEEAVARTPELLDKLRDAGVVDAGGAGLVELVRGIQYSLAGIPIPEAVADDEGTIPEPEHAFSEFQFCTNFVVEGADLDRETLSAQLAAIGDSLHVVGDPALLRVHVHTDEPQRAIEVGRTIGAVIDATIDVADMDEQIRERIPDLLTAVVAVAPGAGNRRLFERTFGEVIVVAGGQTANPSAQEILDAVERAHAEEVIVLPNNGNVVGAARQAAGAAVRPVLVVETKSVQEGLAAVTGAYTYSASADDNVDAMTGALDGLHTGEVTRASRSTITDGIAVNAGDWLGLVDGRIVVSTASFEDVALAVADGVLADGADTVTIIVGSEAPRLDAFRERFEQAFPRVDHLEIVHGGQPHYPLLVFA